MSTYTVEVVVKHRHNSGYHVATIGLNANNRKQAVRRAEVFCGGIAVEAHNNNPSSGGGSKRG